MSRTLPLGKGRKREISKGAVLACGSGRGGVSRAWWKGSVSSPSLFFLHSVGFLSFQELHPTLKSGGPKQMVSVNEITLFGMCGHGHTPTLLHTYKLSFLPSLFCFPQINSMSQSSSLKPCPCVGEEGKMGSDTRPNHLEEGGLPSECSLALAFPCLGNSHFLNIQGRTSVSSPSSCCPTRKRQ